MEVHSQQRTLKKELSEFLNLDTHSEYPTVAVIMEDDGDEKDDTKRKTRNLSEKKRRDEFNSLVMELSNLISNNRKMDKSAILRSTISFLKNHNEVTVQSRVHDVQEDWKPAYLSNDEFTYLVMEALEGFIMVFSTSGRIYYASESISSLLGHNPAQIVDKNIFDMMHKDDQQNLYNLLQRNAAKEHIEHPSKVNEMISFQVHLQRGCLDFREEVSYDEVQFYGHFRINQEQDNERDDMDFRNVESSSRVLFVCIGCLRTPKLIRDVTLVDPTCNEFTSRHSLEWKFLFLDHRAPPIIGYLPFEVLGTSGYDYYHFDDLDKVVTCHEALMQKGELTSCYYRFLTKGQQWIWLQTRFYITYHQWNSKPEFVVCAHRVVSYADVMKAKEVLVEQDTKLAETDNAEPINEMPDNEPEPKLSSPFKISEANNDAYANAYPSTSQINMKQRSSSDNINPCYLLERNDDTIRKQTSPDRKDGSCKCENQAKKSTQEPLVVRRKHRRPLQPLVLQPLFPASQVREFQVPASQVPTSPVPESQTPASQFPGFQVPGFQVPAFQVPASLVPASQIPEFQVPRFQVPASQVPASQVPASQVPASHVPASHVPASHVPASQVPASEPQPSRPERTMSSLSALLENFPGPFDPPLQPSSVKPASSLGKGGTIPQAAVSTANTWIGAQALYTGGSVSSVSVESREPHIQPPQPQPLQPTKQDCLVASQHGMGVQYPDATSYDVSAVPPGLLSLTGAPPLQDQAQIQEQLQRKHEMLQLMIARQQEELRHVKEQLALARLGILHPLINVPGNSYSTTQGELQNQEPNYSAQGPLPELGIPSIPAQPPQQLHPDQQHNMPQ